MTVDKITRETTSRADQSVIVIVATALLAEGLFLLASLLWL